MSQKVKVGDLVRPRSYQFGDQVGLVIAVGFVGGVGVRLLSGRIATYNMGALEIISESGRSRKG